MKKENIEIQKKWYVSNIMKERKRNDIIFSEEERALNERLSEKYILWNEKYSTL